MGLIVSLLIGALAGYLANHFMDREKSSLLMNLLLGIGGAWLGGWVFSLLGFGVGSSWIPRIISATAGAALLVYIVRAFRK